MSFHSDMHVVTEKEKSLVGDHVVTLKVGVANRMQYNQERLDKG